MDLECALSKIDRSCSLDEDLKEKTKRELQEKITKVRNEHTALRRFIMEEVKEIVL
jgi:hypothetical protein